MNGKLNISPIHHMKNFWQTFRGEAVTQYLVIFVFYPAWMKQSFPKAESLTPELIFVFLFPKIVD